MSTIAQERAALAHVGQKLRTREQAGFRFGDYDGLAGRATVEPAPLVFVHITITNPRNYASDDAHARAVEAIGISRFPNTGISYNRLLMQSGTAYEGQPMGRRGAHTVNDKGILSCTSSGCPSKGGAIPSAATNLNNVVRAYAICQNVGDAVTAKQLEALARAIAKDQLAGLVKRGAPIHGHRCVAWKDCPAAKMWALMGQLETRVAALVKAGLTPPVTTPSPGDDMADLRNDIVGNDNDGSPMTMGELSSRMNALYTWFLDNGKHGARLVRIDQELAAGGDTDTQLDRIEADTDAAAIAPKV